MNKLLSAAFILASSVAFAAPKKLEPSLIGGTPAPAGDWPASVYASMGNARCSATVIGERTLLIANHCVGNGAQASFSVGANQYRATCSWTPGYPANETYDWALCLIDRKVEGIKYERLATDAVTIGVGTQLRMTGYGCTSPSGQGGNDGVFRIGTAPVIRLPSGTNADIVTRGTGALCFGDSGGAAYFEKGSDRFVVGVNSRGDISTTSYLPDVRNTQFKAKIASWKAGNGQKICGVDADAVSCRGTPDPQPVPPPKDGCLDELAAVDQYFSMLSACLKAID